MSGKNIKQVGIIGQIIVDAFSLRLCPDTPIFCGSNNRRHMNNKHHEDYVKYEKDIELILASPDFVGINPKNHSLEYYKKYGIQTVSVKIAVRPTKNGVYFARTLYTITESKLFNYLAAGRAKQVPY